MPSSSNNKKRFKESEQQQDESAPIPDSLSLFVSLAESFSTDFFSRSPTSKSPTKRSFDDGAVGLGIVAAMIDSAAAKPAASIRTEPGPIFSTKATAAKLDLGTPIPIWKEEEDSESYTCVISHVGGKSVRKRVYLDGGSNITSVIGADQQYEEKEKPVVLFFNSPPPPPPPVRSTLLLSPSDFLSFCYLCNKNLDGLDIFMYRGEKPFCSPECRCQHILSEEHLEKCGSEALKPFDFAVSTCSVPFQSAGIATA